METKKQLEKIAKDITNFNKYFTIILADINVNKLKISLGFPIIFEEIDDNQIKKVLKYINDKYSCTMINHRKETDFLRNDGFNNHYWVDLMFTIEQLTIAEYNLLENNTTDYYQAIDSMRKKIAQSIDDFLPHNIPSVSSGYKIYDDYIKFDFRIYDYDNILDINPTINFLKDHLNLSDINVKNMKDGFLITIEMEPYLISADTYNLI